MMKRLAALFLTGLLSLSALAQGNIALLDKVAGHRVHFHYTYSLSRGGAPMRQVTDGEVVLEDNAYRLSGLGLDVCSNGATRWSVDSEAGEVLIETVDREDVLTNPAVFIGSYRNYLDRIKVNSSRADALDVTLTLDEDTVARFVLTKVRFSEPEGKSDFTLDVQSLPTSYVVTDLR